jgi:hypothetical protein
MSADRAGAPLTIDSRARLCVPAWLRRQPVTSMLVGTRDDTGFVVIAPTTVLDPLGDVLVGESP